MALPNIGMNFTPYDTLTAAELDNLVENIEALADGTGLNDAVITQDKLATGADFATGWNVNALPAVTAVTNNGNRSYTLTHASSVASLVSEGMRRRFQRTVAANTYMGGLFNGSSHYFTKTTPSGTLGTVTNNFTIEAYVQPTSYVDGIIAARADATPNNGLVLRMSNDGTVWVMVVNGGNTNYRILKTYQSLPLNKKTHVAASWASGTVVIYFDGVSVPVAAAVTSGTAPTTAGTGGDFSVGRYGAYAGNYFAGYISNVAVFDAVLSAATIREHATRKLLGNETNCIGAWSLDNTANDQSAAGNNLTATGGVGFSNVSPFGNNGKSSTLEYGLTMSVSSDGLTEVVQVPEGCALPTAITSQDYSTQGNPFGWVSDKGRWEVSMLSLISTVTSGPSANTFYGGEKTQLNIPVGNWLLKYEGSLEVYESSGGSTSVAKTTLSTSSSAETDKRFSKWQYHVSNVGNFDIVNESISINYVALSSATLYHLIFSLSGAGIDTAGFRGDFGATKIEALPSGL